MAKHVKIREDRIAAYAATLPNAPPANVLDGQHHYSGDAEGTACYILALDSVNFGSGYQRHLVMEGWELIDDSLYFSISSRLKNFFDRHGPLTARHMSSIDTDECIALFELNGKGAYSFEFARLCALALRELGQTVVQRHDGSCLDFVRSSGGSAASMVRLLASMHHFNDVHEYRGHIIPFYKRAQIAAADLHLAFARLGETLFSDIGRLTMFPDNGVPHVLRTDGLLDYTQDLAARIGRGENIPMGSEEEVEIRACAGHVVEQLAFHKNMIPMSVDHILWHKSVEDPRYREAPAHLTLTPFY